MTTSITEEKNKKPNLVNLDSNSYINIRTVCEILDIGFNTAHRYIKSGALKATKIGNFKNSRYRILVKDLKEFMNFEESS